MGDDYGLTKGYFSFDMALTGGEAAIGTRLFETRKADIGLWFHIYKDTIIIEERLSGYREFIEHGIDLSKKHRYVIADSLSGITLKIGDKTVCSVLTNTDQLKHTISLAGFVQIDFSNFTGLIDNAEYTHHNADGSRIAAFRPGRVVDYASWIASDDLGRVTPDNAKAGNPKSDKYVGLFYFINNVCAFGEKVRDHTKIYCEEGLEALKAFLPHSPGGHWAEPYFGYYLSTDEWIYRKHAAMFTAAGIDFIFLDMSNAHTYPESHKVLFDTWLKIRKEGGRTPGIVPMCGDMPSIMVIDMYTIKDTILGVPEYDELLFKWEGKPLILGNNDSLEGDKWTVSGSTPQSREEFINAINADGRIKAFYESGGFAECMSKLTLRKCWAWQAARYKESKDFAGYWDWLDEYPQAPGRSFKGAIEQISVAMGTHAHSSKGRSYLGKDYGTDLQDFDFTLETAKYGLCFEQQFRHALEVNPQVIMITGWNEWYAGVHKTPDQNQTTGHTSTPGYTLIDQFNPEFSRDGEPMKLRSHPGFGDNYYYQMVNLIREFKGIGEIPVATGQKTVDITEDISVWHDIGPEYRDTLNDTAFRKHLSWGGVYMYINNTGRNDLDYAKVSQDDDFLYFLITTSNNLITSDDSNWMNLFIDVDCNHNTGWEGYDFILNRSRNGNKVSVERFVNNSWAFESVGEAEYSKGRNSLTIKVPKELLNVESNEFPSFDFKWADNSTTTGDIMQFMDLGDAAPDNRFNFRYLSKKQY